MAEKTLQPYTPGIHSIAAITGTIANIAQSQVNYNMSMAQIKLDKEMARELQKCNLNHEYDSMTLFHIRMPANKNNKEKMAITQDFKARLNDAGLQGLVVENGKLIIRTQDLNKVRDINLQLCLENCYGLQEIEKSQFENVIAKSNKFTDKEIIELKGLDKVEVEILKNKCNKIQPQYGQGFTLGVERDKNDFYNIVIAGDNVLTDTKEKDFCQAYIETQLSLYGPNRDIQRDEIEADLEIDRKVMNMVKNADYQYIISVTNKDRYIRINEEGFDVINITPDQNGQPVPHVITELHNDIDDPYFNKNLYQQLDMLEDKAIISSREVLKEWRENDDFKIEKIRPDKTFQEKRISRFEDEFSKKIDTEIRRNFDKYDIKFDTAYEKFDNYKHAFVTIIESCSTGIIPEGMDQEYGDFLDEVQDLAEEYDVNLEEYYECTEIVQEQETEHHPAKEAKIIDIGFNKEKYQNERRERPVSESKDIDMHY